MEKLQCDPVGNANGLVVKRLTIGRRISEYISKSHNARVRYNAYDCFIKLIERNSPDFQAVWSHRMSVPRKKREGDEFLNMLRTQSPPDNGKGLALRLLWLLEQMERQKSESTSAFKPLKIR